MMVGFPTAALWVLAGEKLRGILSGPWRVWVNAGLALSLVACLWPVLH